MIWVVRGDGWFAAAATGMCGNASSRQQWSGPELLNSIEAFFDLHSWSHFGQNLCSPFKYPCFGQIEKVGVIVMYGILYFVNTVLTRFLQTL